ncbi:M56 family metallopeptidase [Pedosphaera parvula]|uniref:Peptidase M56 BlaR1 n=1 Tax=Pedosphaera parvula (strain Ellin514) TaxID=320771 RepID=B9XPJ2_PEDPL|nr:M56 family metallopeptidase [Pedosphaera parvula]EEF58220.1 peptidase M56 BlaR1 [Pedosphaera parvula Ellin514]
MPTLIFPLSLLTTLPQTNSSSSSSRTGHVRRDDYLANLCQLLIEAILFFNPAVWWISRQMRIEREACCDALAINLVPDRAAYAHALAHVAEQRLLTPKTALAFAADQNPSSLKDRIQRLLIPGYRPSMRLTWTALFGSLLLGSALLILSALGTQWTVHAAAKLLSPQERIARIEKSMQDLGQTFQDSIRDELKIPFQATVKTADGSPLPAERSANFTLINRSQKSSSIIYIAPNGLCTNSLPRGTLFFSACAEGYAPGRIGPINTRSSNRVEGLELVLDRGFPITIHLTDADSRNPIPDADIAAAFYLPSRADGNISNPIHIKTDSRGNAVLEHCGTLLLVARVQKEGYETVEKEVDTLTPNQVLEISTRPALAIAGTVLEKSTSKPLAGASIYVLHSDNALSVHSVTPWEPSSPLATTDAEGKFQLAQLPRQGRYELLIQADGYRQAVISKVTAGQTNLQVSLTPPTVLHGKVTGDLSALSKSRSKPDLHYSVVYTINGLNLGSYGDSVPLDIKDGVGYFELTNYSAGDLDFSSSFGGYNENARAEFYPRDSSNTDVSIVLETPATPPKTRKVIVRFQSQQNISPKGTVFLDLPLRTPNSSARKEIEIQNGEVQFDSPVGHEFYLQPGHMVGYWFDRFWNIHVDDLPGPLVTNVNVIPAGAMYAQTRNPDNSLASDVMFSVKEVKPSPLRSSGLPAIPLPDGFSSGPRKFVATPLPLGGTYQILTWRKNNFAVSEHILLTEENPDYHIDLQLKNGVPLPGQILSNSGEPVAGASVVTYFHCEGSGFGGGPIFTDENGRFTAEDCSPTQGEYSLEVHSPGFMAEQVKVDFNKLPIIITLQPGLKLSGRVIEIGSKRPLIHARVHAFAKEAKYPQLTTLTDEQGNFTFDEMSSVSYNIWVEGGSSYNWVEGGSSRSGFPFLKPGQAAPATIEVNVR